MIYLCVIFTIVFVAIIEVFTILFQLTGISKSKARFQVISILTGTGFTTKESELITSSNIRRNIAQAIMIFGFTTTATVVTLLFSFVKNYSKFSLSDLVFLIVSFVIIYFFFTFSPIRKAIDKMIEDIATRALFGNNTNVIVIKDSYDNDMVIAEVVIKIMPNMLKDKRLWETPMTRLGVMVLVLERVGTVITSVTKDTMLEEGDTITVFGPHELIDEIFYKSLK